MKKRILFKHNEYFIIFNITINIAIIQHFNSMNNTN